MVTDEILRATELLKESLAESEQRGAECVIAMLGDFDEDQWLDMMPDEQLAWIKQYI